MLELFAIGWISLRIAIDKAKTLKEKTVKLVFRAEKSVENVYYLNAYIYVGTIFLSMIKVLIKRQWKKDFFQFSMNNHLHNIIFYSNLSIVYKDIEGFLKPCMGNVHNRVKSVAIVKPSSNKESIGILRAALIFSIERKWGGHFLPFWRLQWILREYFWQSHMLLSLVPTGEIKWVINLSLFITF